jgi:type II secretory pathway pseudopilin PulG
MGLGVVPAGTGYRAVGGMALPEMMVAVAVGSLILMVLAQVFMTSAFSFAAIGNYVSLGSNSRLALDQMTREIRQAGNLVEFSPSRLKFALQGQTNAFLIYEWDAQSRQLTESKTGDPQTRVLLPECDRLAFAMRDSAFAPTTAVSQGKGISVAWQCSRTVLGKKTTTEDMEQALIIMRNKPL